LGCVLYEMLAGAPPFTGPNAAAIVMRHVVDSVPPLGTVRSTVPLAVIEAIDRALAKSPVDRFSSIGDWKDAIRHGAQTTGTASVVQTTILKPPATPPTRLLG